MHLVPAYCGPDESRRLIICQVGLPHYSSQGQTEAGCVIIAIKYLTTKWKKLIFSPFLWWLSKKKSSSGEFYVRYGVFFTLDKRNIGDMDFLEEILVLHSWRTLKQVRKIGIS